MAKRVNTPFVSVIGCVLGLGTLAVIFGPMIKHKINQRPVAERVATLRADAQELLKEGRISDARNAITLAAKLDPSNKEVSVEEGDILVLLVQEEGENLLVEARRAWENALAGDPAYKPALQRLLDSYIDELEVKPSPDACLHLRDAAARSLDADPSNTRAKAYVQIAVVQQWVQGMHSAPEQFNQAIATLAEIQKKDPSFSDVMFYLLRGKTFKAKDDYTNDHAADADAAIAQCRALLDAAVTTYPKDAPLNFRAFQGYVMLMEAKHDAEQSKKDHISADAALNRARGAVTPEDPRYIDFQFVASDWARRNGHMDEAEKILRELYKLRPTDQRVRLQLCRVLALTADPAKREEAVGILKQPIVTNVGAGKRVVSAKELEAETLLDLTSIRVSQYPSVEPAKRPALLQEIESTFQQAKDMSRGEVIAVWRLQGQIAELKGDNIEAVGDLERAMTLLEHADPTNPTRYDLMFQLATVERLAQQNESAIKLLTQIVDRFDGYTPARIQLADLYLDENNLAEAARNIDTLVKQNPESPDVVRLQMLLAQREGKVEDAAKLFARLPEKTFEEKFSKAQAAANLKDYSSEIRLLEPLIKERPDDTGLIISVYQACVLAEPSRKDEGKKYLDDAVKRHPEDKRLKIMVARAENASAKDIGVILDELADSDPFTSKIRQARKAFDQGNLSDALARTGEAEQIRHNDPTAWDLYFRIYVTQNNWDMAGRAVETLARLNADQAGGTLYRWRLAMARGQYSQQYYVDAISIARDLVNKRQSFGQSWICLAQAFQKNGQTQEAIEKYQAALERQTTNIDAYVGIADCYEQSSRPDRALETIKTALRLFPENLDLRERKFNILQKINPSAVVPERQKVLNENPGDAENYLAMAGACVQAAQQVVTRNLNQANAYAEQARDVLTRGVGKFPDNLRLNSALADALQNSSKFDDGVKILQDLAEMPAWKDKPEPLLVLGDYYGRASGVQNAANAEKAYRAAWAKVDNKNFDMQKKIDVQLRLVAFLEEHKRWDEALAILQTNAGEVRIHRQTLQVNIAANRTDAAIKGIDEELAHSPKDVDLLDLKTVVEIDGARYADARVAVLKALEVDPRNTRSLYYQALIELKDPNSINLDLAIKNLKEIVLREPANVQYRLEDAGAKMRIRDNEGAAADLEEALKYQPFNRDARLRLLDLCIESKKWQKFEEYITFAETNPILSGALWFRAHAYELTAQDRFPDAIAKIKLAIEIDKGKNPTLVRDLLYILLQSKDYPAVIQESDRQVAAGRREWWLYQLRGVAHFAAGRLPAALEQFDKAMVIADEIKDPEAYQQTLNSMADASLDDAIHRVETRLDVDPRWRLEDVSLHMRKAEALTGQGGAGKTSNHNAVGEWSTCLTILDPLLKTRAQLPRQTRLTAISLAAQCLQSSGHPQDAKKLYLEWLAEAPTDPAALNNFAYLLAEDLHDPQAAKQYSGQAYEAGRKRNYIDPLIVDTHGWVLSQCQGEDRNLGLAILNSLVGDNPDFLDARYHLAKAYLLQKHPSEALNALKTALDQIKVMEAKGQTISPTFKAHVQSTIEEAQHASASTR